MAEGDDDNGGRPVRGPSLVRAKVIRGDAAEVPLDRPALGPPRGGGVLRGDEAEARTTAQGIVQKAQQEAQAIIAAAARKKDEIFRKATEDAKAEVVARASEEIAKAKLQAGQVLAASEKDILELALRVSQKIIGRDLERDPKVVVEICANAIENARSAKALTLLVNPKDGQTLRDSRPKLMEAIGRAVDIAIKDDPDIQPGGCIIKTEFGTIDAQLSTQYDMLKNLLFPEAGKKEVK
ncbi:MAG: FliH/SctL family protein [Myxococcaceae bacterium]